MPNQIVVDLNRRMAPFERRRLEESAVEIRNPPKPARGTVSRTHRCVETTEEQWGEHRAEEVAFAQTIKNESPLAVEPTLLLNEREKQKPRQNQQCLGVARV